MIRDGAEQTGSGGGKEEIAVHRHKICFIGDSHAVRLSRASHTHGATIGRLIIGFESNSDCAKNGLGSDMKGDERWLRIKVSETVNAGQAPDFAVISMGGNALAKRPRPGEPMEMKDDVPDIISGCESCIKKIMDLLDLCEDLKVILMGVVPRAGL